MIRLGIDFEPVAIEPQHLAVGDKCHMMPGPERQRPRIADGNFRAAAIDDVGLELTAVVIKAEVKLSAVVIATGPILCDAGPAGPRTGIDPAGNRDFISVG